MADAEDHYVMTRTEQLSTPSLALRPATAEDAATVRRLAALDSAPVPADPLLIGTIDGVPAAALSLATGAVVADPFVPTAALVALLRMRAEHLRGPARSPGGRRLGLPRLGARRALA